MIELFSKGANLYFEFQEVIAILVGFSVFLIKGMRSQSSPKFQAVIEAAVAATLIPSGLEYLHHEI